MNNPGNYLVLTQIDLGPVVNAEIRPLERSHPLQVESFRKRCLNFYVRLAEEIKLRFPFSSPDVDVLQFCSFVDPTNLNTLRSISPLADYFKYDVIALDSEYRQFRNTYKDTYFENESEFWRKVKRDNGTIFANIIQLRDLVRLLPHTSAACEREFSKVSANKTKTRNRMEEDTLCSLLRGKIFLRKQNKNCYNCQIPDAMINKMGQEMYNL